MYKFAVKKSALGHFLTILEHNQSALVTYRGYPHYDYIVELSKKTDDPYVIHAPGVKALDN